MGVTEGVEAVDRKTDSMRVQILLAASRQLAAKPYSQVNLDGILASACVTRGVLYNNFRSKYEVATAIVKYRSEIADQMFDLAFFRTRPALAAMIEVFYAVAVDDIRDDVARAGFNLLEAIGRFDGSQATILHGWIAAFAHQTRRAIDEGDVIADVDPTHVASTLVSLYMSLRQTPDLNQPQPSSVIRRQPGNWRCPAS